MRLKAIMTKPVEAIGPSALITTAERRLMSKDIHHRVGDAMIRNVAVATPQMTVREVADLMMPGHAQTAVPVVANNRLVGIVSISDLLELACGAK